jgi:hypothetical protein
MKIKHRIIDAYAMKRFYDLKKLTIPKIKGYLLQNLCAGSVNNEKDENVAICHLFCSLLKWI